MLRPHHHQGSRTARAAVGLVSVAVAAVAVLGIAPAQADPPAPAPFISPLLNDYDLVLVQEDWDNPDPPIPGITAYHDILVAEATHPYRSVPAPVPLGSNPDRPTALVSDGLNRLARFPFGEVTRVMWPGCFGGADTSDGGAGDCLSEKGFSVAATELAPGVEADIYNLHAEAGNTAVDIDWRRQDFELLAAYIVEHSAGRAVIVGGDYNLHIDRAHDRAIYEAFKAATGLVDTCDTVDCGADVNVIDRFLYRSGDDVDLEATSHRFERATFVRPTDGAPLSDHSPLHVDFRWTVQEAGGPHHCPPGPPPWARAHGRTGRTGPPWCR